MLKLFVIVGVDITSHNRENTRPSAFLSGSWLMPKKSLGWGALLPPVQYRN
jgi:hypothetical protein